MVSCKSHCEHSFHSLQLSLKALKASARTAGACPVLKLRLVFYSEPNLALSFKRTFKGPSCVWSRELLPLTKGIQGGHFSWMRSRPHRSESCSENPPYYFLSHASTTAVCLTHFRLGSFETLLGKHQLHGRKLRRDRPTQECICWKYQWLVGLARRSQMINGN